MNYEIEPEIELLVQRFQTAWAFANQERSNSARACTRQGIIAVLDEIRRLELAKNKDQAMKTPTKAATEVDLLEVKRGPNCTVRIWMRAEISHKRRLEIERQTDIMIILDARCSANFLASQYLNEIRACEVRLFDPMTNQENIAQTYNDWP